jgi:hypothetical protein
LVIENRKHNPRPQLQITNRQLQIQSGFRLAQAGQKKIWLSQSEGLRGLKFGRCLAPESMTWSHWKPGQA